MSKAKLRLTGYEFAIAIDFPQANVDTVFAETGKSGCETLAMLATVGTGHLDSSRYNPTDGTPTAKSVDTFLTCVCNQVRNSNAPVQVSSCYGLMQGQCSIVFQCDSELPLDEAIETASKIIRSNLFRLRYYSS
jgi:hypothetical protein